MERKRELRWLFDYVVFNKPPTNGKVSEMKYYYAKYLYEVILVYRWRALIQKTKVLLLQRRVNS